MRTLQELLDGLPPELASKALSHSSWVEERAVERTGEALKAAGATREALRTDADPAGSR